MSFKPKFCKAAGQVGPGGLFLFGVSAAQCPLGIAFMPPPPFSRWLMLPVVAASARLRRGFESPEIIKCLNRMGFTHPIQASRPRGARTPDPRIKSPLLYQLSYRPVGKIIGKKSA